MKYLLNIILIWAFMNSLFAQNDSTVTSRQALVKEYLPKNKIDTIQKKSKKITYSISSLDSIISSTIASQLFLIKDASKQSKSLKQTLHTHIQGLHIGVLAGQKIIVYNAEESAGGSQKKGQKKSEGQFVIENYTTGNQVEWKNAISTGNYTSIPLPKQTSTIALGDSTMTSGFFAVATIQDSSTVDIKVEFYPTLEACRSATLKNASGILFSVVPDAGSLKTHVLGFLLPEKSAGNRILFLSSPGKRKK